MRPAGELPLVESGLGEQRADGGEVKRLCAMRRASNSELGFTETERLGSAALDQRDGPQGLDGGARIHRTLDRAKRKR